MGDGLRDELKQRAGNLRRTAQVSREEIRRRRGCPDNFN
jgi:hypothetical protein